MDYGPIEEDEQAIRLMFSRWVLHPERRQLMIDALLSMGFTVEPPSQTTEEALEHLRGLWSIVESIVDLRWR